jgi:hypothetical protein
VTSKAHPGYPTRFALYGGTTPLAPATLPRTRCYYAVAVPYLD